MLLTRHERTEQLRLHAQEAAGTADSAVLVDLSGGDTSAVQSAWSSFAPFLAHPVMAAQAGTAMAVLDATASALAARQPVSA